VAIERLRCRSNVDVPPHVVNCGIGPGIPGVRTYGGDMAVPPWVWLCGDNCDSLVCELLCLLGSHGMVGI